MTYARMLEIADRWWPAPPAVIGLLVSAVNPGDDPAMLLGTIAVLAGFAISRVLPLLAMTLAAAGLIFASTGLPWLPSYVTACVFSIATGIVGVYNLEPGRRRLWIGGGILVVALIAAACRGTTLLQYGNWFDGYGLWLGYMLVALLVWAIPFGVRAFMAALAAERSKQTVQARATVVESELRDERLRADLTHDFHDVMAHSLAVLAAQAEGLRLTHRQHPERIDPVLTTISDTARLALVEVRQLLERVEDDARRPQPTVADVPALIDQTRTAGPHVAFHDAGRHGSLPQLGEIAAYRIVQEALTNALRHGGSETDIVVTLAWTGPGLSLAVSSPIRDREALGPAGRGITGMHERAKHAGGWVDIDADGDAFVVTAYLPYAPEQSQPAHTLPLDEDHLPTVPVRVANPMAQHAPVTPAAWLRSQGVEPKPDTIPTPPVTWGLAATPVRPSTLRTPPSPPAPSSAAPPSPPRADA